ncbi:MAG: helix-turn-helix domain-containing protein [Candidatus Methylomirabilia bacterium]
MELKDKLTLSEASRYLAIDPDTLSRLAAERAVPSMQVDGQWIFSKKSIDKWRRLKQSRKP